MIAFRAETDSLGEAKVLDDVLRGARTQHSLEHFGIGQESIPLGGGLTVATDAVKISRFDSPV